MALRVGRRGGGSAPARRARGCAGSRPRSPPASSRRTACGAARAGAPAGARGRACGSGGTSSRPSRGVYCARNHSSSSSDKLGRRLGVRGQARDLAGVLVGVEPEHRRHDLVRLAGDLLALEIAVGDLDVARRGRGPRPPRAGRRRRRPTRSPPRRGLSSSTPRPCDRGDGRARRRRRGPAKYRVSIESRCRSRSRSSFLRRPEARDLGQARVEGRREQALAGAGAHVVQLAADALPACPAARSRAARRRGRSAPATCSKARCGMPRCSFTRVKRSSIAQKSGLPVVADEANARAVALVDAGAVDHPCLPIPRK